MEPNPIDPPQSALRANCGDQVSTQSITTRLPARNKQQLLAIVIDNIPLFACLWCGHMLLRRIDSDYINVTALCQAITRPHLQDRFRELPGAVVVEGNGKASVNGIWVHLSLIIEQAEAINVSKSLARVLLDENAINFFPRLADTLAVFGSTQQGPPRFGPPFGHNPYTEYYPSRHIATANLDAEIEKGMRTFRLDGASPLDVKSASESRLPPTVQRIHQLGTSQGQDHASAITSKDQFSTMVHPLEPSASDTPAIATEDSRASKVEENENADREESVIREA